MNYDESGYQSVVILQVLVRLIGSILDGPIEGCVSAGPWGECGCNEREVAVLAFKAVTR